MFVPELKVNFLLVLSSGGYGVCSDVRGWTSAHTLRGSNLGCNSEAWHQGGYDI
jgi:hypothetical protein